MKLQEYLKTKKNFSTELAEIFKIFISYKDHELTEDGEDRVEYIIKKLGIKENESGIIEQLEYFLGFKLDISAGVSDKELFTKTKQIEGFKSNFFKEGGIEISEQIKSVDKYLKYFGYDDLSEIDNKAIAKLSNIKEFWDDSDNANEGENNSSSDYSAASYQVLKYFKKLGEVEEVEIIKFKEIIYTLGIAPQEVQDENIAKKLNLLLEEFGINKAGDFSSENLDKIRILKEELNISVREDLKLEIKEKINIIEEFKLVDAGYEEIRAVTGFLGRLGKKISNIEEGVGPDIENYKLAIDKLGIRNVPISEIDNVIANLGILGTSLANIIQFPSSFDTIKEATNLLAGEEFNKLKSQAIWNIVEVLKIFLGINCAEIKGEDLIQITKLAKLFKNLNIKVEELPYGNSMRFKEALKRLDVTLDTPEGNVSELQKIFAILDIKAGELNENTVSNFIALNHEFTEIIPKESRLVELVYKGKILQEKDARIIKEIGNAFLYQRIGEINTQEISKIKEFLKLANVLDLKSVNQSETKKLGIIISELGINIRNIAQIQIENIVRILNRFAGDQESSWIGSSQSLLNKSNKEIKDKVANLKEKFKILGWEKLEQINTWELDNLIFYTKEFGRENFSADEAKSLKKIFNIFGDIKGGYIENIKQHIKIIKIIGLDIWKFNEEVEDNCALAEKALSLKFGAIDQSKAELVGELFQCLGIKLSDSEEKVTFALSKLSKLGMKPEELLQISKIEQLKILGIKEVNDFEGHMEALGLKGSVIKEEDILKYNYIIGATEKFKNIKEEDGIYQDTAYRNAVYSSEAHKNIDLIFKSINHKLPSITDVNAKSIGGLVSNFKDVNERQINLLGAVWKKCKIEDDVSIQFKKKFSHLSNWVDEWGKCKDGYLSGLYESCKEYLKYEDYLDEGKILEICELDNKEEL